MESMEKAPCIAMVPSPGMGHLIPLVEFAKLLVTRFDFSVSLLIPTVAQARPTEAQTSSLNSLPSSISHIFLPPVDPTHLPEGASIVVTISVIMAHSIPAVRAALARTANVVAVITDLFGSCLFDVIRELGIPPYMYFTGSAMYLLFCFYLPKLDETVPCEYRDMRDPLFLPGCVPVQGKDLQNAVQDRKGEAYKVVLDHVKRYVLAEGIFVNTFVELEHGAIRTLQTEDPKWPPIYPIGPIISAGLGHKEDGPGLDCLRWLDQQPSRSVLFVSFGSGGTVSYMQVNELAIGLEKSGQRFLWVVKRPNDESLSGSYINGHSQDDKFDFLPEDFFRRTVHRGLLVPNWAPQIEVLRHGSIGGFLTHCGWNSSLESIIHGVPLITWPLFAEQKMNAVMLNEGLRVGVRPNANEHGIIESDEIAKVVKDLMEGDEGMKIRYRMRELSDLAKRATGQHGDSSQLFEEVALKWIQRQTQES